MFLKLLEEIQNVKTTWKNHHKPSSTTLEPSSVSNSASTMVLLSSGPSPRKRALPKGIVMLPPIERFGKPIAVLPASSARWIDGTDKLVQIDVGILMWVARKVVKQDQYFASAILQLREIESQFNTFV